MLLRDTTRYRAPNIWFRGGRLYVPYVLDLAQGRRSACNFKPLHLSRGVIILRRREITAAAVTAVAATALPIVFE